MKLSLSALGFAAIAVAWSVTALPASDAAPGVPASPTFTKDVLPIFQKACQDCHRPGQMAPFSLVNYEDARPWARSIKDKVVTRYMPPWHIDRTIGEYSPDPVAERCRSRRRSRAGSTPARRKAIRRMRRRRACSPPTTCGSSARSRT